MTRLVRVELARLAARRLMKIVPLLLLAGLALAAWATYEEARWQILSEADAQEQYEMEVEYWEQYSEDDTEWCLQDLEDQGLEPEAGDCEWPAPNRADFIATPFDLTGQALDLFWPMGLLGLFIMVVLGGSATAAEFSERSIGTWLTFEPRRGHVYASKLAAPGLVGFFLMLVYVAATLGIIALVLSLMGGTVTASNGWASVIWIILRLAFLGGLAAAAAAALGMLLRRTAGVLGLVIGYLIVVEIIVGMSVAGIGRYLLGLNGEAWTRGGYDLVTWECGPTGECVDRILTVGMWPAGLLVGAVAAAVIAAGWQRFRTADIE